MFKRPARLIVMPPAVAIVAMPKVHPVVVVTVIMSPIVVGIVVSSVVVDRLCGDHDGPVRYPRLDIGHRAKSDKSSSEEHR